MITQANSLLRLGAGLVPPPGTKVRIDRGRRSPYFLATVEGPGWVADRDDRARVSAVLVEVTAVARLPRYDDEVFQVGKARLSVDPGTLEVLEVPRPCPPVADWLRVGEVVA